MAGEQALDHRGELGRGETAGDSLKETGREQDPDCRRDRAEDPGGDESAVTDEQKATGTEEIAESPGKNQHEGEPESEQRGVPLQRAAAGVEIVADGGQRHRGGAIDGDKGELERDDDDERRVTQ